MGRSFGRGFLLAIFALLTLGGYALAGTLPDTGQTKCYNDTEEITCPQPGEDFYGQDGSYLINPPSYTKLDENGNDLPDDAVEWVMVRDNVTGLIWEVKSDDGSIHDKDDSYTWNEAQNVFIAALNNAEFGGNLDWRIPTIAELTSIVNNGRFDPAINTAYFPNTESSYYWSSTTYAYRTYDAWRVYFGDGSGSGTHKLLYYYVRAVRGGQSGALDHWVTNGDGTVTDTSLGLMWQQATQDRKMWQQALSDCESLSLADYTDWRLPTSKELLSIVDYGRFDPAINTAYFPNTVPSYYWSSTTSAYVTRGAARVHFSFGLDDCSAKVLDYCVRAVRGGQHWLLGHLFISTPQQGSAWKTGDSMPISWETQGITGDVQISISRQGGKDGTFETIEENTENDGTYNWTVTGPVSVNCVLKIEPSQDTSKGTSQGLFSIYAPPIAITGSASAIGGETATLNGTVNPGFLPTAVGFEWGEDETYGNEITATQSPLTGGEAQNVSGTLDGLTPARTYHYRVKATNSAGTSYGEDKVFTTEAVLPSVTTIPVTSIGPNTAQGGGEVIADGGVEVTARGICWSTSPNPNIASEKTTDGTGIGSFTSSMTGLAPGTTYHVRAYATNSAGTAYGSDIPFTTLILAPTAVTDPATSVGATSATLNGTVNPNGASTTVVFEYGIDTNYGSTVTAIQSPLSGSTAQPVSANIPGLMPGTTYHYRIMATNSEGTSNGADQGFTTLAGAPTAVTNPATSIASGSATLNGTVNPNGASTDVSFEYGLDTNYGSTATAGQGPLTGNTAQPASAVINGLAGGLTYHYRVKATNSVGTAYGADQAFSVTAQAPGATTGAAESVTSTTATLNGTVNPNGIATIYYFEYGTTTAYGFITGQRNAGSGWDDVPVNANIAGLLPNTTYHFHIVATSTAETTEGNDASFKTLSTGPCPDCSGSSPVIKNFRFRADTDCQCTASSSVTIGPNVVIENGARVTLQAPKINVKPGVEIQPGAIVNMRQ